MSCKRNEYGREGRGESWVRDGSSADVLLNLRVLGPGEVVR